jgi:tetratricopeptide (TPR) repeat protein
MFDKLTNQIQLSPEAMKLKDKILSIPSTIDPILDDLSHGVDPDEIVEMYYLALDHPQRAIPLLKKRIKLHPDCKPLWNYLYISYQSVGQRRQASAILSEIAQRHPNYLFGRITLANNALSEDRLEQAIAHLGTDLDMRSMYPERDVFHVSEIHNFYFVVARIYARRGESQMAIAIQQALDTIDYSDEHHELLENEIMLGAMAILAKTATQRHKDKIIVKTAPLTLPDSKIKPPSFHHSAIKVLYDASWRLYANEIEGILSLPDDTLAHDLIAVIRDCTVRGPLFLKKANKQDAQNAAYHAFHLLAEIEAICDVRDILAFFSVHPDVLKFCYHREISCYRQIARLIDHDLPTCFAWLRTPGIHHSGKGAILEAIEWIAKTQPERLTFIQSEFGSLLAFLIDSPPKDNILDSDFVSDLIHSITALRSTQHLPLIRKAYEIKLVDDFFHGTLDQTERSILDPMESAEPWFDIYEQYDQHEAYIEDEYGEDEDDEDYEEGDDYVAPAQNILAFPTHTQPNTLLSSLLSPKTPVKPTFTPPESRNAACPCGSGKKYKKCCAP